MSLKKFLIEKAVQILVSQMDKEAIERALVDALNNGKDFVDSLIDSAKERIEDSETQIDDKVLLPILKMIEKVLDLPDD